LVSYTFSFFDPFFNLINYNIINYNINSLDYYRKLYLLKEKYYFSFNKYNSYSSNKRFLTDFVSNFKEKFIRKDMFNIWSKYNLFVKKAFLLVNNVSSKIYNLMLNQENFGFTVSMLFNYQCNFSRVINLNFIKYVKKINVFFFLINGSRFLSKRDNSVSFRLNS
jgi:hypothetical protein